MLRGHLGGSGARRLTLLALVAVVVGAGLWFVNGDGSAPKTTRLEATQSSIDPLLGQAQVGPWDTAGPATPGQPAPAVLPQGAPGTAPGGTESATTAPGAVGASAGAPTPAPTAAGGAIGRADSVDGGVDGGAGSESEPEPTSARGTGAATSSAELSGGATSAPSAPSAGESPTTTEQPTTTSTPTTQATTTTTAAPVAAPSAGRSRNGAAEAEVVPLTNQDRAAAGLPTLSRNSCLDSAASGFAEQMARSGVLAHNSGAGAAVGSCRPGAAWGDNVGTAKPCDTALLEEEWMDSPSHRRNILTGEFRLIGVGAWTDDKGACWVQVLFSS